MNFSYLTNYNGVSIKQIYFIIIYIYIQDNKKFKSKEYLEYVNYFLKMIQKLLYDMNQREQLFVTKLKQIEDQ